MNNDLKTVTLLSALLVALCVMAVPMSDGAQPDVNIGIGSGDGVSVIYSDIPDSAEGRLIVTLADLSMDDSYFMEIDGLRTAPLLKSNIDGNRVLLKSSALRLAPGSHSLKVYDENIYNVSTSFIVGPAASSVELSSASETVVVGGEMTLSATVSPAGAIYEGMNWTSDNEDVATIVDGKITAVSAGTAVISVAVSNPFGGECIAQCTVNVVKPVESVSLDVTELTLGAGGTAVLKATVSPADAAYEGLIWESSATDVASVDNGTVIGLKAGTAVIKVTAGDKSAECSVTVTESSTEVTLRFMDRGTEYCVFTGIPGSSYVMPDSPVRVGYTFVGWEPAPNGVLPEANQTVEAVWKVIEETENRFDNADESKTVITEKTESKDGTDVRVGTVTTESKDGKVVSTTVITDDGKSKKAVQTITIDTSNGVSEEMIDAALRQTELGMDNLDQQPDSVMTVVDLNASGKEDVDVPASVIRKITDSDLVISTKNGTVTLDSDVCRTIGNMTGEMNLSVEIDTSGLTQAQKDTIGSNRFVNVNLIVGSDKVSALGGTANVKLDFSKDQGMIVKVFHVDDNGVKTEVPCSYSNGTVTFSTEHFSVYVVEQVPEPEPAVPTEHGSDANTTLIVAFVIVFLIVDLLIVMYFARK